MWGDVEEEDKSSRWITLTALRVLMHFDGMAQPPPSA